MKKNRSMALAAAVMMLMTFSSCKKTEPTAPAQPQTQTEAVQTTEAVTEEKAVPAFAATEIRDISSMELIKEMHLGWNLGNTLDALVNNPKGSETPDVWETAWGQPVTTKPMIDQVKSQGFNVLRIPVTWDGKFGDAPDYKIDEAWMSRVQEIVDYALEDEMFVIINMHHEDWNMPTPENEALADEKLRAMWGQIADNFAGYNEHLIFECMNEPRLKGTPMEWTGGNKEAREIINHWNASFIETVRSKGGNNAKRHLMIPGYAASSSDNVLSEIALPDDDKVIVSVHAYLPYLFALAEPDQAKDTWSEDNPADTHDIDHLMEVLNELFISKGRAVIIGEFGMRNRHNLEARTACAGYYVRKATEYGIPCVWWDNNAFVSGEAFGLFDRRTFEWRYPSINKALNDARDGK
ncbi:MAG: glycoside hydrolase family 5 protein [Oscillospiraceae bacterium]|nr:glycoside hydrolase family 5 protein [Oscillospiraceae bacterium]